jgi:putative thioredoxin
VTNENVINTTAATFEQDVIGASHGKPVLVDFWAEWCGPCRSIAPILEQLADELDGELLVAKVDTDAEQELAQTFGIRSLPTMMLFRHGKPVEQIIGAQPATVIRAAVEKLLPRPATALVEAARVQLAAGDIDAAGRNLDDALALDRDDYAIHPLLANVHIRRGDYRAAEKLLEALPINVATDDAFAPVRAILQLAQQVPAGTDREELAERPVDDVEAQYLLCVIDAIGGEFDAALERLFNLLEQQRNWRDGAIHRTILDVFKLFEDGDSRLKTYRTRLARTLN